MAIGLGIAKGIAVLAIPLLITAVPLALLMFLRQLKPIRQSVSLTALTAILSTGTGLVTPFLGTLICAGMLANGMPDNRPKCVMGAVLFVPVGYLFTGLTLLVGVGLTVRLFLRQSSLNDHQ